MVQVFESYGLKCNKQRLWHTVNALKIAFIKCGFVCPLLYRINSSGFVISDVQIGVLINYPITDVDIFLPLGD